MSNTKEGRSIFSGLNNGSMNRAKMFLSLSGLRPGITPFDPISGKSRCEKECDMSETSVGGAAPLHAIRSNQGGPGDLWCPEGGCGAPKGVGFERVQTL